MKRQGHDADWQLVERLEVECDAELPDLHGEACLSERAQRLLDVSEDGADGANRLSAAERAHLERIAN